MSELQSIYPIKGMDLSTDESFLPEDTARFIRGWNQFLSNNPSSDADGGISEMANERKLTKNPSTQLFANITLPSGDNYCILGGYVEETAQYYSCVWNGDGHHTIWRLDAKNQTATKVIQNSCLNFKLNPENFISKTRFTYVTYQHFYKNSLIPVTKTWIFIADDNSRTKQIPVEDCIATNGLTHSFFSSSNGDCCSVCDMITFGAPAKPIGCIDIVPVPRPDTDEEKQKQNYISFKVWQFRLKYIDVWGRESVHGVISNQYYNSLNTSCVSDETKMPRSIDLTLDAGCKYIASVHLEYRICGVGNTEMESDWVRCDIIDKYSDCDSNGSYIPEFWLRDFKQKYYQPISDSNPISYNAGTNKLTVRFSGNKETALIPKSETDLNSLYIANKSKSVFKIGNKIGVANNERGFNPLSCKQREAIKFSLDETNSACNPSKTYKVTIWGYIYSPLDGKLTNIRYFDADNNGSKECIGYGRAGKTDGSYSSAKDNPKYYNQYFGNGAKHFIMYAVGHDDYYVEGKQCYIQSGTNIVEIGPMQTKTESASYLQKWELNLPNGSYVLRIGAPYIGLNMNSIENERAYRRSSANMYGITTQANPGIVVSEQYEIHVDVCNGDVNMRNEPILIWDLTRDVTGFLNNLANVVEGYIKNTITGYGTFGIENCSIGISSGSTSSMICHKTDANGHYFGTTVGGVGAGVQLQLEITDNYCNAATHNSDESNNTDNYKLSADIALVDKTEFVITGTLKEQTTFNPVQGMVVVYQNGRSAITDSSGKFKIYANGLTRTDKLIFANLIGGCIRVRTDNQCSSCFDSIAISVPACADPFKKVDIGDVYFLNPSILYSGSIFQGKYGAGIVVEDCMGMETFIQAPDNNYIEVNDSNKITKIQFDISALNNIPNNFKYLSFYITDNLTYSDWLEWVIDYAILEDNNGNIAQSGVQLASKKRVRLYIYSQTNYTAYGQANTNWQFLKGDLVQIYSTGSGSDLNITKLASYRNGDQYITIDYEESTMADIVNYLNGAKIRFLRPRIDNVTERYYQLCNYIKIVNGAPETTTGVLNFQNSYRVSRSIPYYESVVTVQDAVVNQYNPNGDVISSKIETIPVSTPTPNGSKRTFILIHHSPSDFFGNKCFGRGRINIKNRYESVHRLSTEMSVGYGISSEGLTNYLHWFTPDNATSFDEQVYHGITGVFAEQNIILAICTNDYFTLLYNQSEFRTDEQTGQIFAIPASNKFGQPRTKSGNNFGCSYSDHNTMCIENGIVWYLDGKNNQIIRHNFEIAEPFAPIGLSGWLQAKCSHVSNYNKNLPPSVWKYFHGIVDPKRNQYILTVFKLFDFNPETWVNNKREIDLYANETVCIGGGKEPILFDMPHYTPEAYGILKSEEIGIQLVSFKNGIPYIHYAINNTSFLNYYGTQCKPVVEFVFNKQSAINKNFLSIVEKIKQHNLYSDRIVTESGQKSHLMPWLFVKGNNDFAAAFRSQTNGTPDPNAIMDGQTLFGKWIKVRLLSHDSDDNKYAELFLVVVKMQFLPK